MSWKTLPAEEIASTAFGVQNEHTYPIQLSTQAGQEVWRVIHNLKQIKPSRFGTGGDDDYTGWIWLNGKKRLVETGYWGGVVVWRLSDDEDYPVRPWGGRSRYS